MKKVQAYKDNSGRLHATEAECKAADARIVAKGKLNAEIEAALSPLGKLPDDLGFVNGHGWIAHSIIAVSSAVLNLEELTKREHPAHAGRFLDAHGWKQHVNAGSFITGRLCEGSDLWPAWGRLMSIAPDGREFGQPYYANNPDRATGGPIVRK